MTDSRAQILVICHANICRSPAGAALLAARLGPDVDVISRGVHAYPGAGICPTSARWVDAGGGAPTSGHESRQLELADIRASTMILTASHRQREHVVSMRPSAQVRTFTIAQAARIGAWSLRQGVRSHATSLPDRLLWLTEQLNANRAAAAQVTAAADDIPDPHRGGTHAEAFPVLTSAIDSICTAMELGQHEERPGQGRP